MNAPPFWPHVLEAASDSHNARTLLLLHGTGGDERSLLDLGRMLDAKANLLSPRGQVLENGAPRWFRRFAEGVFDEADIRVRAGELREFLNQAVARYGFNAENVVAVGYSNGANIAAAMLLLHGAAFREAVLLRPMVPLAPDANDLSGARLWLGAGRRDPIVPVENSERLAQMLSQLGANVTLRWHNGGHELSRDEFEDAQRWLQTES